MRIVAFMLVLFLGALGLSTHPYPFVVVSGNSMDPTLAHGQFHLVDTRIDRIQRGDVVVFRIDGRRLVKRVVYLPGDKYALIGVPSARFTTDSEDLLKTASRQGRVVFKQIPPDHVFVVGDNQQFSTDSRMSGPVPVSAIEGRIDGLVKPIRILAGARLGTLESLPLDAES